MKRRADRLRPRRVIDLQGRELTIATVRRVRSEVLGELIELTFTNGSSVRRPPGAQVDVIR